MNEIILNKKISIERCIEQIDKYYAQNSDQPFATDHLKQDAIGMNLQRACELSIDIDDHFIKTRKLGLPQDSRDSFALLHQANLISADQMKMLQAMVGFRNILIHEYQKLDIQIMIDVIEHRMRGLVDFSNMALKAAQDR